MPIMMSFTDFMQIYNMVDQDQQDHRQALEQQALSVGRNTTAATTTGIATTAAAAKVTRSSSSTSTSSALTIASSASATTTTATTTATTSSSQQQQQNGDDHEDDIQFQADFLFQSPSYVRRNKAAPSATSSALSVPGRFVANNENLNNCRDGRSTRRLPFVSYLKRRYVRKNGDNHNSESTVPLVNGRTRVTPSSATTSSATSQQSPASTSSSSNIPLVAKTEPSDGTSPDTSIRSPGKRRLLPNKRLLEPESGDSDQQVIRKKKRPGRIHYPIPRPNPPPVTLSSPSSSTSTSPSKSMPLSQNRIYLCGESYRRTESRAQVRVLLDLAGPIKQETELADG